MATKILNGELLDETVELSLADLCQACSCHAEWVLTLVDEGVLEPVNRSRPHMRFTAISLERARRARHLQRDLGINLQGVALALDLLEQIDTLNARLIRLDKNY
jgi:chaperone modulatory protein CbpM